MKRIIIEENEYLRLKELYEKHVIDLLLEINIGKIAREVKAAGFLKDIESAKNALKLMKEFVIHMDDIVRTARKIKSLTDLDDIVKKLVHIYNPGQLPNKIEETKTQVVNLLNAYSQNKGFQNFNRLKDDVMRGESSAKAASGQGQGFSQGAQQSSSYAKSSENSLKSLFSSGQWITSSHLKQYSNYIDFSKITNAKNIDDYNKLIAAAIQNPEKLKYISRGGFEKFGIDDFRDFLNRKGDITATQRMDPNTGFWTFKIK